MDRISFDIPGIVEKTMVRVQYPDAEEFNTFTLYQPDRRIESRIQPASRQGDTMTFRISRHGMASCAVLRK